MKGPALLLFVPAVSVLSAYIPLPPLPTTLTGVTEHKKPLSFDANGIFKVISFSDMHFGERFGNGSFAAFGPENDMNTQRVHATILDYEKPNYVTFNGDIMTGENVFKNNATGYMDQCFKPTVERNIPFSSTHGNHDNAINITHQEEIEYEMKHYGGWKGLSYTRSDIGPKPYGSGNYWVPVYATKPSFRKRWYEHFISPVKRWYAVKPALIMWFLDSREFVSGTGDGPGPIPPAANYYWVDENTVPRYIRSQARMMRKHWGSLPASLVFVHVPFNIADNTWYLPTEGDHDDTPNPAAQGSLNNSYTGLDVPTFTEIVGLDEGVGKVLAVVSGHDHGDSWCARSVNTSAVTMCFDGHSGYGGYVTPNSKVRNGRVFNMTLADLTKRYPEAETWNSYENVTRNDRIRLSTRYMEQYNDF